MISPSISHSSLNNNLGPPLQESGSWAGKVVTKVHEATSYVVSSISSVAQSILSSCIYVGTLGRYTLDDLKDYFSKENASLECNNDIVAVSSTEDDIEEISEVDSSLKEARSNLKRHGSKMSVHSTTLRRFRSPATTNSFYQKLYGEVAETLILSTCSKTPEERLAEMERSVINKGK